MGERASMNGRPAFRYVPYQDLNAVPNVIVDGSATAGTVMTLSHWPNAPVPEGLEADLSAEMAMTFLTRPDLHGRAEVVSNNHFDQDGLVSVFALVDSQQALQRRDFLVDVAAAGDFATYRDRAAAHVSMIISAFADHARSPLASTDDDYDTWCAALYEELLGRLPEMCDHPERYRDLWADEDDTLRASELFIRSERVRIEETPALDLTVVHVPEDAPDAGGHRFGHKWVAGLHPMALNNAIRGFAVLILRGRSYEFAYRYESWVQYQTRRPRPRVDLRPLAHALSTEEVDGAEWIFEGTDTLIPRLYLRGSADSALSPERFRARLEAELANAAPAWDPYGTGTTADAAESERK